MSLCIAFITGRTEPRLDWVIDGIVEQVLPGDRIELLVVDVFHGQRPRPLDERLHGPSLFMSVVETAPKPTIWQGPHRVTSRDWWAISSARNTALVLCQSDYIVFLDDRCRLGPKWMAALREGMRRRDSVLAGTYDKRENGQLTADTRRSHSPNGKRDCGGGWLYGCTFALPVEWALEVNGLEEGCDGMGGEDYIFGLNLANRGRRIDFVTDLRIEQDRNEVAPDGGSGSSGLVYKRIDKGISPNDKSHAALARFGKRDRTEFTPDLMDLRYRVAAGLPFPCPDPNGDYRDWYDGKLIREM